LSADSWWVMTKSIASRWVFLALISITHIVLISFRSCQSWPPITLYVLMAFDLVNLPDLSSLRSHFNSYPQDSRISYNIPIHTFFRNAWWWFCVHQITARLRVRNDKWKYGHWWTTGTWQSDKNYNSFTIWHHIVGKLLHCSSNG
jgi:hypothetical protein